MLVLQPFTYTFAFTRPLPAPVRRENGLIAMAIPDEPRFDHLADGSARGLLVEMGPSLGVGDHLAVNREDSWHQAADDDGRMTVVHEYEDRGIIFRRAWYTIAAAATVDACLTASVHHRLIAAYDGYLDNRDGDVIVAGRRWRLAGLLGDAIGPVGDINGDPLGGS